MLAHLQHAIKTALSEKNAFSGIYASAEKEYHLNDFILFLKPEIVSNVRFDIFIEILSEVLEKIKSHPIKINQIYLLHADYLSKETIIEEHYKAINDVAKAPLQAMASGAKKTFRDVFGLPVTDTHILGGWEMLNAYPELDAQELDRMWQQSDSKKLDGGVYCSRIQMGTKEIFLVNGFAPIQIAHYTEDNSFILLFDVTSDLDWHFIRHDFCGATRPSEAKPNSLRYDLFANQKRYGIDVSISKNGVHVSAGPVEGLKEKMNFLQIDDPEKIPFGKTLLRHFSSEDVHRFIANKMLVIDGEENSVFNLTENLNSDEAIERLKDYQPFNWSGD
ncbi:MAG: hypothetical protein R6U62_03475 [Bacteroidales bacterium]